MDRKAERVQLETDRYRIIGDLTMPREGYLGRLSDYLNQSDLEFLPLSDAQVTPLAGGEIRSHDFLAVARRHVRLVHPTD
ncbi:MAG: DUF6812 domain-containing protein [Solirubrobacterales bacterium]